MNPQIARKVCRYIISHHSKRSTPRHNEKQVMGHEIYWIPIPETNYIIEYLLSHLETEGYLRLWLCEAVN
jgi:hypothetical protein